MDKAKAWVNELQRQADPNIVIALAGNKSDLEGRRAIETKVYIYIYKCILDYFLLTQSVLNRLHKNMQMNVDYYSLKLQQRQLIM